jgi:hypothetical protein
LKRRESKSVLAMLEGGHRRGIGRSNEVAALVARDQRLFPELIAGLWSDDPVVRTRAADAAEKVTRENCELLHPHKKELLGLAAETTQQELRWHLAAMLPRLRLSAKERQWAASLMNQYLEDHSSIVKTCALQALADLAQGDAALWPQVIEALREATRTGTAAMKARSRKLLLRCMQAR